ncbi:MAG: DUF5010 C-terminal domain-containing protein [Caldilineaceae bacterium]
MIPTIPTPVDHASGTIPQPVPQPTQPGVSLIPGRIEAEDYKKAARVWAITTQRPTIWAVNIASTAWILKKTSDSVGKYNTGWTEQGEWLAYDGLQAAADGIFSARVGTWDKGTEKALRFEVDGRQGSRSGEPLVVGDKDSGWVTVTSTPVQLAAGVHEIKVVMDAGKFRLSYIEIQADPNGPSRPPAENPANPTPHRATMRHWAVGSTAGNIGGTSTGIQRATDLVVCVYDPGQSEPRALSGADQLGERPVSDRQSGARCVPGRRGEPDFAAAGGRCANGG